MADIVTIGGSPSSPSRSAAVLERARTLAEWRGATTHAINVRDLDPADLLHARIESSSIQNEIGQIERAHAVVLGTPIYKAAYSGLLKAFLDLLPAGSLREKVVLPIATGGSPVHFLAIDYALKPVLAALGAQHILGGIYVVENQVRRVASGEVELDATIDQRLHLAIDALIDATQSPSLVGVGRRVGT